MLRDFRILAVIASTALVAACGGSQKNANMANPNGGTSASGDTSQNPSAPPAPITVDASLCDPSGKRVEKFDINRDSRPDVWEYYATSTDPTTGQKTESLTCKMVDLNFDGKVDMTTFYNKKNERLLEMLDLDFDGRPDEWVYFEKDVKIRTAIDADLDGKPDTWRIYDPTATGSDQQRLVRIERATRDPNKVDYWEYWSNGHLERIGYDTTGDGTIDKWETAEGTDNGGGGPTGPASGPSLGVAPPPTSVPAAVTPPATGAPTAAATPKKPKK